MYMCVFVYRYVNIYILYKYLNIYILFPTMQLFILQDLVHQESI